jgi:FAD reductase [NAD(P)H]
MKVLGISGTLFGKKTSSLVNTVLREIQGANPEVDTELLDLSEFQVEFCDGRQLSAYNNDTQVVLQKIMGADTFIIGTPIFQASMTGALKNLLDLIPPQALRGKVIGFLATGGTYQHYLVIENQLKPIAGYFKAYVTPDMIYAHRDHFNEQNEISDPEIIDRIEGFARQVVEMSKVLSPVT